MCREHPLRIIRYSVKNIWLLIFPILRSFFRLRDFGEFFSPAAFVHWLQGVEFDLLVLALILGFGWLKWYFLTFTVENDQIYVREGFLYRRIRILPAENLSAVSLEHPFWLRPFHAAYVYADTAAGILASTDIRLLVRERDIAMFTSAMPRQRSGKRHRFCHHAGWMRILLFSVLFSSTFSGSLYLAAFWFQGGRITAQLLEELHITQRLNEVSEKVAARLAGIPPAAVTLSILIMLSWLVSFFFNLMRYGKFSLESDKRMICVRNGIFTKRRCLLRSEKINYIDIRQNLPAKACRIYSLHVSCPGFGNQKGNSPICLPLMTKKELGETLPLLFSGTGMQKKIVHPPLTSIWGFIWQPVLAGAAVIPAMHFAVDKLPQLSGMLSFLRFMLLIPVIWKLVIQIAALLTDGVSISGRHLCLRYERGLTFHTILADTDCVTKIRLVRTPLQQFFGKCNAVFYFRGEVPRRCTLRCVDEKALRELLAMLF